MATDTRLWLYGQVQMIRGALRELIAAAADRAEAEVDVLLPGFTHLQPAMVRLWLDRMLQRIPWEHIRHRRAQARTAGQLLECTPWKFHAPDCLPPALSCLHLTSPRPQTVRWSHWLLSHAAAWQRDDERLRDLLPRLGTLPLGSGKTAAWLAKGLAVAVQLTCGAVGCGPGQPQAA